MLLSEIIYNFQNLKEGGLHSDDIELSDEQVIYIFNYYRAKLIRQDYNKSSFNLDGVEQDLGKVIVEDLQGTSSIKNSRVTEYIPKLIQLPDGLAIRLIGSAEKPYQHITPGRASYIKHARFTNREGFYYPLDNRVILLNNDNNVTKIPLVGIFENPVEAIEFKTKEKLEDYNINYPVSSHMIDTILKMMVDSEIRFSALLPDTNTNDTKDDQDR